MPVSKLPIFIANYFTENVPQAAGEEETEATEDEEWRSRIENEKKKYKQENNKIKWIDGPEARRTKEICLEK